MITTSLVDGLVPDGRALVVTTTPSEDEDPIIREGLARRAMVATGGECPCGARMVLPGRAERRKAVREGRILRVEVRHEDDCPAVHPDLVRRSIPW